MFNSVLYILYRLWAFGMVAMALGSKRKREEYVQTSIKTKALAQVVPRKRAERIVRSYLIPLGFVLGGLFIAEFLGLL